MFSRLLLALIPVLDNAEPLADMVILPLDFLAEHRKQYNLSSKKQILSIISALKYLDFWSSVYKPKIIHSQRIMNISLKEV